MTEKKEKILHAALVLFAKEGFKSTSTSKVAKHAGVSEGLIFRHFENKDGLLEAIMKQGEEKAKILFADIVSEMDPKEVIRKTLKIGQVMNMNQEDADFWKLQYKIKWEMGQYGAHKLEPLERALINAFSQLGYEEAELEARLILISLDGLATRYYLQKDFDIEAVIEYMKMKYHL